MSKLNPEEEFKHMANEFSDIQLLEEVKQNRINMQKTLVWIAKFVRRNAQILNRYRNTRQSNMILLQNSMCEDCERIFKSEKKLKDHKRFHAMFKMDDSDKIYMYKGILK